MKPTLQCLMRSKVCFVYKLMINLHKQTFGLFGHCNFVFTFSCSFLVVVPFSDNCGSFILEGCWSTFSSPKIPLTIFTREENYSVAISVGDDFSKNLNFDTSGAEDIPWDNTDNGVSNEDPSSDKQYESLLDSINNQLQKFSDTNLEV